MNLKLALITYIIICISTILHAQQRFNSEVCCIINPKLNVIWLGIDNEIEVTVRNLDSKFITVEAENAEIRKKSDGNFIVKVSGGSRIVFSIYDNSKYPPKLTATSKQSVRRLPSPVPHIGKYYDGDIISLSALKRIKAISADVRIGKQITSADISAFTITTYTNGAMTETQSNSGNFTTEQQAQISKLKSGDYIYFEKIITQIPDNSTRLINLFVLQIE